MYGGQDLLLKENKIEQFIQRIENIEIRIISKKKVTSITKTEERSSDVKE